ncbi:tol-pal system protein YbgF [Rubripirellula lacrimiformis]|uniref:Tol-pal system protein YbgF n=1 Tax=Rubripirellula lacrimiformis TaxID=1930273 RepID=A0A517N653_9BACT|nr:tetratricopeptide repeat protein [Rubripirellula lacrimiformis]QDT02620.1 tol-pal system protein YbgF [Rubripirellula lacrimiformis]
MPPVAAIPSKQWNDGRDSAAFEPKTLHSRDGRRSIGGSFVIRAGLVAIAALWMIPSANDVIAQDPSPNGAADSTTASDEASMAAYADAANFQTGGALELAIQGWDKFLAAYPNHPMASKAAHYLGVCHMQTAPPDYAAASKAFAQAIQDKTYDLREESLANYGWCLYASAGDGAQRDMDRLKQSLATFQLLRKEFPKSRFSDRAIFYCGEASYGLGQIPRAIAYYDELLALPEAKDSPLRCDTLYARGVAQEELNQPEDAISSYQQLLSSCDQGELVTDVHLRLGDLAILRGEHLAAVKSLQQAIESTDSPEDQAYAIFRQAFALAQADQAAEAAAKYEQLLSQFPESEYAASATLASAQSIYRSGDIDEAAKRFAKVLQQTNPAAATEASHWLARIAIDQGKPSEAAKIAQQQIDKGLEGDFATEVRLDLAESLSMDPQTIQQSLELFEQAYRESPDGKLAPRALYNAAFSALQINQPKKAIELADEFVQKFPNDMLISDVRFVAAEGHLQTGNTKQAAQAYENLIASTPKDNVQRPVWVLRAATTSNASGTYADTIRMLQTELGSFPQPAQKADANLLIGQAELMLKRPAEAAIAFAAASEIDPQGPRAAEARLMVGQAQMAAGQSDAAIATWKEMVTAAPDTRMADQARYKLAQSASTAGNHSDANTYFDQILGATRDPGLLPYAQYGKAFSLLQAGDYEQAMKAVNQMIDRYPNHPLANDALLTRGIAHRNSKQYKEGRADLEKYLAKQPSGVNLGHALYELALIDQTEKLPAQAAKNLQRLVSEVPQYPSMDKVLYELGWSMQEVGDDTAAADHFRQLTVDYPDSPLVAESSYFLGQRHYVEGQWKKAADQFLIASERADSPELSEKALYRLGWSHFKVDDFDAAEEAFAKQAQRHPDGRLSFDALMMVAESRFKEGDYPNALEGYRQAKQRIRKNNDTSQSVRGNAERQVRELTLLHGGQSAAQLKDWDEAIQWYNELRERFPASDYLPQVFYESGFAYQQKQENDRALKFYGEVAENYRSELAARARFMMGEIHFADRKFDQAIPEFQRVMFGFGAQKAPASIKNWQAKSGFEAGRCSELLIQSAQTQAAKQKATKLAEGFYQYVAENHPQHELAEKSSQRLEALTK